MTLKMTMTTTLTNTVRRPMENEDDYDENNADCINASDGGERCCCCCWWWWWWYWSWCNMMVVKVVAITTTTTTTIMIQWLCQCWWLRDLAYSSSLDSIQYTHIVDTIQLKAIHTHGRTWLYLVALRETPPNECLRLLLYKPKTVWKYKQIQCNPNPRSLNPTKIFYWLRPWPYNTIQLTRYWLLW